MKKDSKLIQFLKSLNKEEKSEFGKFIKSPYHNNRADVVHFFEIISRNHPAYDNEPDEKVFSKLYPKKNYVKDATTKLSYFLYNLGKEYLSISKLKKDKYYSDYFLLQSLDERNCEELFEKEYKSVSNLINTEKPGMEILLRKALLRELNTNFYHERTMFKTWLTHLPEMIQTSMNYHLTRLIILFCNYGEHGLATDIENKMTAYKFLNEANLTEIKEKENNKDFNTYFLFYYLLLMCIYHPEDPSYYTLITEHLKTNKDLSVGEFSVRITHFERIVSTRIYKGDLNRINDMLELYTLELERLPVISQFNHFFSNFVMMGLNVKQFDKVEKFISEHHTKLTGDEAPDIFNMGYANLYFCKKEYSKSLYYLAKVNPTYFLAKTEIKILYIKIYYETDSFDALFSQIDSFSHYLRTTNEITEERIQRFKKFINYVTKLAKIKLSDSVDSDMLLELRIKEPTNLSVSQITWLKEKTEELINRKN